MRKKSVASIKDGCFGQSKEDIQTNVSDNDIILLKVHIRRTRCLCKMYHSAITPQIFSELRPPDGNYSIQ